jgi:hypothetical protein
MVVIEFVIRHNSCHVGPRIVTIFLNEISTASFNRENMLARLLKVTGTVAVVDTLAIALTDGATACRSNRVQPVGMVPFVAKEISVE